MLLDGVVSGDMLCDDPKLIMAVIVNETNIK